MIVYLTFGDGPSGVYWSQVTDVVTHLQTLAAEPVRLVALVSGRGWRDSRRQIVERVSDAIVLPHVPSTRRWRYNLTTLGATLLGLRARGVIARGALATDLALSLRKLGVVRRVCFDARGAYAAEAAEYYSPKDQRRIATWRHVEQRALQESDYRIAVSQALLRHWRENYGYQGQRHVVIPCTLSREGEQALTAISCATTSGPQIVFSGSIAGWQSLPFVERTLDAMMREQQTVHLLFLCHPNPHVGTLMERYPGRVEVRFVRADRVRQELAACDVGVLLREDSVTNRVASPVKFAEYLAAGLRVLISPGVGDYSETVRQCDLGWVIPEGAPLPTITSTTPDERKRARTFARQHLVKAVYEDCYRAVLTAVT